MGQKNYHTTPYMQWICGPHVSEACNSNHFYICGVGPSEKIMFHNENGINQKDILLKTFLYVIT